MRSRVNLIKLVPYGQLTKLHSVHTFSIRTNENLGGSTFIAAVANRIEFYHMHAKGIRHSRNTFIVHRFAQ